MLKRILFLLLATLAFTLPCSAAESDVEAVLDPAELDDLMAPLMEEYALNENNFGLAFLYTGTNESYFINGDHYMYAASLFKLPLCMVIAEKVSSGELKQEDSFNSTPITFIEEACLIRSNNTVAAHVYSGLVPHAESLFCAYSGIDEEDLPPEYYNQFYSPRFMLNTVQTLYEDPNRFPNIIECMLQAQPEHYFRSTLEGRYEVAQKYGQLSGCLNNAGIIYTPTPIILVVMTSYISENEKLIGEVAELFADYSLTLDTRIEEREAQRLAEEEAERKALEEAKAAEEAEQQRLAEEEAARLAEEKRLAEEQAALAAAEAKRTQQLSILAGAACLSLAAFVLFLLLRRKRN